jgi:hypothetical protein
MSKSSRAEHSFKLFGAVVVVPMHWGPVDLVPNLLAPRDVPLERGAQMLDAEKVDDGVTLGL